MIYFIHLFFQLVRSTFSSELFVNKLCKQRDKQEGERYETEEENKARRRFSVSGCHTAVAYAADLKRGADRNCSDSEPGE